LGPRPGPGKDGQNNTKTPLLVTFSPEKLKPKTKIFFSILTTRLAESVQGLNSSPALAIYGQKRARQYVGARGR